MLTVTPQALSYMTGLNVQNKAGVVTLKYFMSAHFKNILWWSDNTVTHRPYRNRRANLDRRHQWNRSKAVSHSVTLPLHFKCTHTHTHRGRGRGGNTVTHKQLTDWGILKRPMSQITVHDVLKCHTGYKSGHAETHTETHTDTHTLRYIHTG